MRSFTPPGAPGRCPRCLLLTDYCLCELVGVARASCPQVLIVRHHWEAFKSTGTARLAGLALSNASILDMAAADRIAIAGAHVNAPGFGHVVRKGAAFAFEPAG